MGKRSRDKGARGEREAAEVLRPIFPEVRRRAMQARGGSEGADLDNTPGYHVEVGCGNVNPRTKWEQAHADAFKGAEGVDEDSRTVSVYPAATPVALTRKDRGTWLVTMSAEAWVELVRMARTAQDASKTDGERGTSHGVASLHGARSASEPPS